MHPKFTERLRKLTTPFRIRRPRSDTSAVAGLFNRSLLEAPKEFWDQEFERRLKAYRDQ